MTRVTQNLKAILFFITVTSIAGLIGVSCSQKVIEVEKNKETSSMVPNYEKIDNSNEIAYSISVDEKQVRISLKTDKRSTILKMLYGGLNFSFGSNSDEYLKMTNPLPHRKKISLSQAVQRSEMSKIELQTIEQLLAEEMKLVNFNSKEKLPSRNTKDGYAIWVNFNENNELIYEMLLKRSLFTSFEEDNLKLQIKSGVVDVDMSPSQAYQSSRGLVTTKLVAVKSGSSLPQKVGTNKELSEIKDELNRKAKQKLLNKYGLSYKIDLRFNIHLS